MYCRQLIRDARKLRPFFGRTLSAAAGGSSSPFDAAITGSTDHQSLPPKMEKSLNQVTLLGRVGTSPQLRGTEEHPVTLFTLATHVNYKYQSGELAQKTEWHRVSVFKPYLRDTIYKYLSKGQRVLVQGKLMYGQVTDAGGTIHTTATIVADEVVFFNKAQGAVDDVLEEEDIV